MRLKDQMRARKNVFKLDEIKEALVEEHGILPGVIPLSADFSELINPHAEAACQDLMAQFRGFARMSIGEAIIDRFHHGLMGLSLGEPELQKFKLELKGTISSCLNFRRFGSREISNI